MAFLIVLVDLCFFFLFDYYEFNLSFLIIDNLLNMIVSDKEVF